MTLFRSALALLLAAPAFGADTIPSNLGLVAHEWGTFTSVADTYGQSMQWLPLTAPADLPCFVNRLSQTNPKASLWARVRMETPVIYFYSQRRTSVTARADFPHGLITEWYPQAKVTPQTANSISPGGGAIEWRADITPGETPQLPMSSGASHYFAARETDAAPLRSGAQQEKMLFYRGLGDFSVPLTVAFSSDRQVTLRNTSSETIPLAALFENRQGRMGFRLVRNLRDAATVATPELTNDSGVLKRQLADALVASGLYAKEADAMIATWRDSWFEEGMRAFYIVPRSVVDSVLPLKITPAPETLARVFVGRVEVLSPDMARSIETALKNGDTAALAIHGRFLEAFRTAIKAQHKDLVESPAAKAFMDGRFNQALQAFGSPSCVK